MTTTRTLLSYLQSLPEGTDTSVLSPGLKKVSTSTFVTQAALDPVAQTAGSALQPEDVATVATSGSYNDLADKPTLGALAAKDQAEVSDIDAGGTPSTTTYLRGDGTWATPAGSGSGDVNGPGVSVAGNMAVFADETGTLLADGGAPFSGAYDDLTGAPTLGTAAAADAADFATAAQGALADTAIQPDDLSGVATSGDYGDLSGTPTLGTAAAEDVEAFATAAQGTKADSAVQPARAITAGTGITGGGDLSADRSIAIDKATDANVRAAASNKVVTADLIESACAPQTITYGSTTNIDWDAFINGQLTCTGNPTIANPTNVQPGTMRTIRVVGNDATERSLSFGSNFTGPLPEETVTSTVGLRLYLFAESATEIDVTWKVIEL